MLSLTYCWKHKYFILLELGLLDESWHCKTLLSLASFSGAVA